MEFIKLETGKEYADRHEAAKDTGMSETSILRSIRKGTPLRKIKSTFTYNEVISLQ